VIENEIAGSRKARAVMFFALLVSTGAVIAAVHFVNSYGSSCPHSPSTTCINNLRQIDGAKVQWALEARKGTNDIPSMTDVAKYIRGGVSKCPIGGVYTLGPVAESPCCSITGHALP
jgi:hypothetical protein